MNTDWQQFNSVCGFKAHWRREAATLHLKYPSKPLDAYNVAAKDAEAMFGLKNSYSWISMERGFEFTTSIRVPQWEKEIFDPLPQNAPAFQPYYFTGDPTVDTGGTTVALPADDSRHIRVTIPGMEPTKEGYCTVSVQVGDKTESLVVKESELKQTIAKQKRVIEKLREQRDIELEDNCWDDALTGGRPFEQARAMMDAEIEAIEKGS